MSPAAFRRTIRVLAIALFVALAARVSHAATIIVTSGADSGPNSLRAAIAAANPGDTIVFNLGLPVNIVLTSGELVIAKDLTINGPGAFDFQISGNNASRVFRIDDEATVTLSGLGIVNGRSTSSSITGGGIHNDGTLTVIDCRFLFNKIDASGSAHGGAIGNSGTLTVNRTLFEGNSAVIGGAIVTAVGNATVTNSTFTNNIATRASTSNQATGGSAIFSFFGDVTIVNSTFVGNQATPGHATLGIFSDGTMTVSNSTVAGNSGAGGVGGLVAQGGEIKLKGTILANTGDECLTVDAGQITSLGYNIADDASCAGAFTQTGDLDSTSPGLDPAGLKHNGGPTATLALASGSPAINAIPVSACKDVDGNALSTDQRGTARPQGSGCDIGAYEAPAPPPGPVVTCDAADGVWHAGDVSIRCTATAAAGLKQAGDASFYLMTSVATGTEDANAQTDTRQVCDTLDRCVTAGPVAANKVDRKSPSTACGAADGLWHNADVSVACTATDAGSGLAQAGDSAFSLSTMTPAGLETSNASTGSRQVCDAVGNCATAGPVAGHMIDRKAPAISIASPASTSYTVNQAVSASYSCADGGSNLASCTGSVANGAGIDTGSFGSKTFTVTAIDKAGNTSTQSVSYSVGYAVCVAYDPVKPVNSGATASIKIRLCNAAGGNLSAPGIVVHATQVRKGGQVFPVQSPGNSQPGDNFRFDTDGYVFNLKTTGLAAGAYQLEFTIGADPAVRAAGFTVK